MNSASTNSQLSKLEGKLGYAFQDRSLLERALSHRSVGSQNNERLEFLGDAVLGYVIAEHLFQQLPNLAESRLTLMRSNLVKGDTLAEVAGRLDLGRYLRLGSGEAKSGGHQRTSILADALEAVIGAVHVDGGIAPAAAVVRTLLADEASTLNPEQLKDPKTLLQEMLQGAGEPLPLYEIKSVAGEDHQRRYTVTCSVRAATVSSEGEGASRREAEKSAAAAMLRQLQAADQ